MITQENCPQSDNQASVELALFACLLDPCVFQLHLHTRVWERNSAPENPDLSRGSLYVTDHWLKVIVQREVKNVKAKHLAVTLSLLLPGWTFRIILSRAGCRVLRAE